jgi:hypothetical protein
LIAYSAIGIASVAYAGYRVGLQHRTALDGSLAHGLHRSNAIRRSDRRGRQPTSAHHSDHPEGEDADVAEGHDHDDENSHAENPQPGGADDDDGENDGGNHHATHANGVSLQDAPYPGGEDEEEDVPPLMPRAGHNIVALLFRVSEDNAKRTSFVHRGTRCNSCGTVPIRGVRYHCANCPDFDMCETCEAQNAFHHRSHVLYKIRVPCKVTRNLEPQPVWYTGDPTSHIASQPSKATLARLMQETGMERGEIEAYLEQWTFMANTEWRDDPDGIMLAMDRTTFEQCMVPVGGSHPVGHNLLHDRIFGFYDSNNDGLIGFSEWLHGLTYTHRADRPQRVFKLYDLDSDGYVARRDFLRLFRAHYVLFQDMFGVVLDGMHEQRNIAPHIRRAVKGRQPISSEFAREERPAASEALGLFGKVTMGDGDVRLQRGYEDIVRPPDTLTMDRSDFLTNAFMMEQDGSQADSQAADDSPPFGPFSPEPIQDTAYLEGLMNTPDNIDDLPGLLAGDRVAAEINGEEEEDNQDPFNQFAHGFSQQSTEQRLEQRRKEQKARAEVRKMLRERWAKRQFYLDEEEGGTAPEGWKGKDDVMAEVPISSAQADGVTGSNGESSKSRRSRSSSKVRFAEDPDDLDTQSAISSSSARRSVPERWGGMEIPGAERDAGKEIIYLVLQQAFNELLDKLFKEAEDLAVEVAKSKKDRLKYQTYLSTITREEIERDDHISYSEEGQQDPEQGHGDEGYMPDERYEQANESENERDAEEEGVGSTPVEPVPTEQRHDGSLQHFGQAAVDQNHLSLQSVVARLQQENQLQQQQQQQQRLVVPPTGYDPTLPQFRPNAPPAISITTDTAQQRPSTSGTDATISDATISDTTISDAATTAGDDDDGGVIDSTSPITSCPATTVGIDADADANTSGASASAEANAALPCGITRDQLLEWRRHDFAEQDAHERGGWGRLTLSEFEDVWVNNQYKGGNKLDFLESWIEHCQI